MPKISKRELANLGIDSQDEPPLLPRRQQSSSVLQPSSPADPPSSSQGRQSQRGKGKGATPQSARAKRSLEVTGEPCQDREEAAANQGSREPTESRELPGAFPDPSSGHPTTSPSRSLPQPTPHPTPHIPSPSPLTYQPPHYSSEPIDIPSTDPVSEHQHSCIPRPSPAQSPSSSPSSSDTHLVVEEPPRFPINPVRYVELPFNPPRLRLPLRTITSDMSSVRTAAHPQGERYSLNQYRRDAIILLKMN
ncbi:hypothetical protein ACJQWK_02407 [Exserohilum turcicum]